MLYNSKLLELSIGLPLDGVIDHRNCGFTLSKKLPTESLTSVRINVDVLPLKVCISRNTSLAMRNVCIGPNQFSLLITGRYWGTSTVGVPVFR